MTGTMTGSTGTMTGSATMDMAAGTKRRRLEEKASD